MRASSSSAPPPPSVEMMKGLKADATRYVNPLLEVKEGKAGAAAEAEKRECGRRSRRAASAKAKVQAAAAEDMAVVTAAAEDMAVVVAAAEDVAAVAAADTVVAGGGAANQTALPLRGGDDLRNPAEAGRPANQSIQATTCSEAPQPGECPEKRKAGVALRGYGEQRRASPLSAAPQTGECPGRALRGCGERRSPHAGEARAVSELNACPEKLIFSTLHRASESVSCYETGVVYDPAAGLGQGAQYQEPSPPRAPLALFSPRHNGTYSPSGGVPRRRRGVGAGSK